MLMMQSRGKGGTFAVVRQVHAGAGPKPHAVREPTAAGAVHAFPAQRRRRRQPRPHECQAEQPPLRRRRLRQARQRAAFLEHRRQQRRARGCEVPQLRSVQALRAEAASLQRNCRCSEVCALLNGARAGL